MQKCLIDLALERAGFDTLEQFMRDKGLDSLEAAHEALMPWILGYDLWRVHDGDTFTRIARETGSSVKAIAAANPQHDPNHLRIGSYLVVPMDFPVVPEGTEFTWQLTHYVLRGLQARYPFLGMDEIGVSGYGRPLERVRLGTGPRVVYANASHHANEWITTPASLAILERYARAVAFGESLMGLDAAALSKAVSLYLVPLVNPDGVDLLGGMASDNELAAAQAIAADYPDISFPQGWKANLRGVDLNLNYPARWEEAREIKYEQGYTTPAPRDYVGPDPLSEPESMAMYESTRALNPDVTLAWHTQGEEIYWKFLDLAPEGARKLGLQMAEASGYELSDVPYASSFEGYKDWFIQEYDRPGYTIEAGLGENPLPLDQLPKIISDNLPILLLALSGGDPNYPEPPEPETQMVQARPGEPMPRPQRRQLPNGGVQATWG